ncbi:MAG: hypothetical protein RR623_08195 [Bacilli bacterium]
MKKALSKNEIKNIVLMIKALNELNMVISISQRDYATIGKFVCYIDRLLGLIEKTFEKDLSNYDLDYKFYKEKIYIIFQEVLEKYSEDDWLMKELKNNSVFDVLK